MKKERAEKANQFLEAIAGCGRKFFAHNGRVSRFEVDDRGRVWYIDGYSQRRIYTHYKYQWRGFTEGGTLFDLVKKLRDYIRTGELPRLHLGPYPEWVCGGDPWAYGDDMQKVRAGAERCGLVPHNPELTGERMNEVNEASPASETSDVERLVMRFTPEYEAQLCAAINQKYIDQIGTESYERSTLLAVIKSLRDLLNKASKPEKEEIN